MDYDIDKIINDIIKRKKHKFSCENYYDNYISFLTNSFNFHEFSKIISNDKKSNCRKFLENLNLQEIFKIIHNYNVYIVNQPVFEIYYNHNKSPKSCMVQSITCNDICNIINDKTKTIFLYVIFYIKRKKTYIRYYRYYSTNLDVIGLNKKRRLKEERKLKLEKLKNV